MNSRLVTWGLWIVVTLIGAGALSYTLFYSEDKEIFMPGPVTFAHHQVELACQVCHSESWSDEDAVQQACVGCHQDELKEAQDSHPKSKFNDPRNASLLKIIDARMCVSCHVEHKNEITDPMGLTLPDDFCFNCHLDIGEERETHKGLGFETCANAGCHNYHDNRALYEDFLADHANQPDFKGDDWAKSINALETMLDQNQIAEGKQLVAAQQDAPSSKSTDESILAQWAHSEHAESGVNCSDCHTPENEAWHDKPHYKVCHDCHRQQAGGFERGKHGMQIAIMGSADPKGASGPSLGALLTGKGKEDNKKDEPDYMSPGQAQLPMKESSHQLSLDCNACHKPHQYETEDIVVEACLGCHDDSHSKDYKKSPHFALWEKEKAGVGEKNTGVTCATCHMPKIMDEENEAFFTQHNQSHNLRPNEKMIRGVCMNCHGLQFALDALADEELVKGNFQGTSSVHIESIEMSVSRMKK